MGEGLDVANLLAIDLSRYHDLTKRLAVFDTNGGMVAGDGSDLTFTPEGNEQMFAGEQELARLAGHIEVVGPRSIKRGGDASLGTVMVGPGLLIVTSYRLIAMCQSEKTQSQLGSGRANHVHTIVFLWDLIDSVFMPAKKKPSDKPLTGALLVKEVCRRIRVARSYWDAHNNRACRGEREKALALYETLSASEREAVPQELRGWLRYRSEKYFGEHRTPPGRGRPSR